MAITKRIEGRIADRAVGKRITSLRYDDDSGYVVLSLVSGNELCIAACYEEGYHLFTVSSTLVETNNR